MQHQLKIDSRNLRLIMSGRKTFEIINNDKDFKSCVCKAWKAGETV